MCGLAGVAALTGHLPPEVRLSLPAMTHALEHRGPDGDGFFSDQFVALGHRRLAIIDRSGGDQPIANEDGTCWIVFNGEIYNYRELRDRLIAKGHRFRTKSDTETIVHAYEEFGPACVDYLEGMFAFAIYDKRRRELVIARDRLGKKPLFYAIFEGVLHFASEIKALQRSRVWNGELDFDQLESYLSLGYFLAPHTVFRHVRKLEPGHLLRLHNGRIEVRKYWDIEHFDDWQGAASDAVALVDSHLSDRVRERLESEVPLGAFLSGGIDSGLVLSSMAEHHTGAVIATTVGFGSSAHDEVDLATLTARRYASAHHIHTIDPDLDEVFPGIIAGFDEPFADTSSLPMWYVSREAKRHVTVALSGDGGDESFGGYDFRYVAHALEEHARSVLPAVFRRSLGRLGAAWPRGRHVPRYLRLGSYLENLGHDAEAAYYSDLCFLKPDRTRALMGRAPTRDPKDSSVYEAVVGPYRRCPSDSVVQRAEYADLKVYLPNDVLVKVDRMSMQHSLEVRSPLLDRRLVELAFRFPQRIKLAERTGKHLLKRVAESRLPGELLRAPKHGFDAPMSTWLAGPFARRFESEVLTSQSGCAGLLDLGYVKRAFREHRSGYRDHWYLLWAVWVLDRWFASQTREDYGMYAKAMTEVPLGVSRTKEAR